MRRAAIILLITVAASLVTFWISYELVTRPTKALLAHPDSGMEFLRTTYHLSDAQFARIEKLHQAYSPGCAERCGRIAAANARLRALISSSHAVTPEIEATMRQWTLLQNDCRQAMLQHVYNVSAEMSPEDGKRYLKMAVTSLIGQGEEHAEMMAHAMK